MRPTNFATHLTAFLTNYLPAHRNVEPEHHRAYRDAFVLLLRYCRDVRRLAPDRLSLEQIEPSLVLDFLDHLDKERRCARAPPVTYGSRPSMPSSATFRQKSRGSCSAVNGSWRSPSSAAAPPAVEYLSSESLAAILHQPDLGHRAGRRTSSS